MPSRQLSVVAGLISTFSVCYAAIDMTPERRRPLDPLTLDEVSRLAREVALEHGGHVPTIIAEGDRGAVIGQLSQLPEMHEEKVQVMFVAGHALARSGEMAALKQVFFISEAWMSTPASDGSLTLPPSQDPNRVEVLLISGLDIERGRADLRMFEMVRADDMRLATLKPLHIGEAKEGHMESPLLDAFVEGFRRGVQGKVN